MSGSKPHGTTAPSAVTCDNAPATVLDVQVLHEATDRLNLALLEAEEALQELRLGVSASVLLELDQDTDWFQALEFCRSGKDFKLMVTSGTIDDEPSSFNLTHITSASREIRLRAVQELPALHTALLKAFHIEVQRVEASVTQVSAFVRSLRKSEGA
jgi:hypothetical protein